MTVRHGHFAPNARALLLSTAGPYVARAALRVQAGVQAESPVVTGTLRRGWTSTPPAWNGTLIRATVGNAVIYTRRVDKTSKKNAGFIKRGFDASKAAAINELQDGVTALAKAMWVKR